MVHSNNYCEGNSQPVILNVYKYLDQNINQSRLNFNCDRACIIIEGDYSPIGSKLQIKYKLFKVLTFFGFEKFFSFIISSNPIEIGK